MLADVELIPQFHGGHCSSEQPQSDISIQKILYWNHRSIQNMEGTCLLGDK